MAKQSRRARRPGPRPPVAASDPLEASGSGRSPRPWSRGGSWRSSSTSSAGRPSEPTRRGSPPGPTATSGSPRPTADQIGRIDHLGGDLRVLDRDLRRADPDGITLGPARRGTSGSPSRRRPDRPDHRRRGRHRVRRPDRRQPARGDHARARRQPLVHRDRRRPVGRDRPDHPGRRRSPSSRPACRPGRARPGSPPGPTAPSGSPSRRAGGEIGRITTAGRHHRVRHPATAGRQPARRDRRRARRRPLVHRARRPTRSAGSRTAGGDHRVHRRARPPTDAPTGITAGPDGNLWFTEASGADQVGRITPAGRHHRVRRRRPRPPSARRDRRRARRQPLVHRAGANQIGQVVLPQSIIDRRPATRDASATGAVRPSRSRRSTTGSTATNAANFAATIDYGDGTERPGIIRRRGIRRAASRSRPHTYAAPGPFTATVTIGTADRRRSPRSRHRHRDLAADAQADRSTGSRPAAEHPGRRPSPTRTRRPSPRLHRDDRLGRRHAPRRPSSPSLGRAGARLRRLRRPRSTPTAGPVVDHLTIADHRNG